MRIREILISKIIEGKVRYRIILIDTYCTYLLLFNIYFDIDFFPLFFRLLRFLHYSRECKLFIACILRICDMDKHNSV